MSLCVLCVVGVEVYDGARTRPLACITRQYRLQTESLFEPEQFTLGWLASKLLYPTCLLSWDTCSKAWLSTWVPGIPVQVPAVTEQMLLPMEL